MIKENPDFIIGVGDYVENAETLVEWKYFFDIISKTNIPVFLTIGNHDIPLYKYKFNVISYIIKYPDNILFL